MNEEIDIILSRYFSGESTKKELQSLDSWLLQSNENEQYFQQMTQLYQSVGETEELPVIDTEKALAQFKAYMNTPRHAELVSASPSNKGIAGQARNDVNDTRGIAGRARNDVLIRMAAAIALLVVAGFALYYFMQPSKTIQVVAVETQKDFTLYENAEVTLFPGAEIVYNKKNSHQIQLKGKATFTVQSEESQKLIVQAGETYIEDIGTVFTVDATTPEQAITVSVSEGEVWFYTEKNSGIYLKANESAVYNVLLKQFSIIEEQPILMETPPADDLVFHNTPLYEAIEIIKTRYNVDITISSKAIQEMLLNASFDDNESVEYILEIITATLSAQLAKENGGYVITL